MNHLIIHSTKDFFCFDTSNFDGSFSFPQKQYLGARSVLVLKGERAIPYFPIKFIIKAENVHADDRIIGTATLTSELFDFRIKSFHEPLPT